MGRRTLFILGNAAEWIVNKLITLADRIDHRGHLRARVVFVCRGFLRRVDGARHPVGGVVAGGCDAPCLIRFGDEIAGKIIAEVLFQPTSA